MNPNGALFVPKNLFRLQDGDRLNIFSFREVEWRHCIFCWFKWKCENIQRSRYPSNRNTLCTLWWSVSSLNIHFTHNRWPPNFTVTITWIEWRSTCQNSSDRALIVNLRSFHNFRFTCFMISPVLILNLTFCSSTCTFLQPLSKPSTPLYNLPFTHYCRFKHWAQFQINFINWRSFCTQKNHNSIHRRPLLYEITCSTMKDLMNLCQY